MRVLWHRTGGGREILLLTHVYAKLGLTSRVQLAQQAARHT
jgi:hypothetical protein